MNFHDPNAADVEIRDGVAEGAACFQTIIGVNLRAPKNFWRLTIWSPDLVFRLETCLAC
jgi:hypothetical protein